MRVYLTLSSNKKTVPFNYQNYLVGALHKWLGPNSIHDELSLYSFSWLVGGKATKEGLDFPNGTCWYISAHDELLIKKIIKGIQNDPEVFNGMIVKEIVIVEPPQFEQEHRFLLSSPVFVKRTFEKRIKYFFYDDPDVDDLLTETQVRKLEKAGLSSEGLSVKFDRTFPNPKKKKTNFNDIDCKGSICPVIVKGTQEQIAFAWNVGVGNSTGIGFGALK